MTEKTLIFCFSFWELGGCRGGGEQRPFGLFYFPAELDELISEQNPQNSIKESVIWLVTIEHQKVVLRRIKMFKNLLLLKPLKIVWKISTPYFQ